MYYTILYYASLQCIILYYASLQCIILHCASLYYNTLYFTILHCSIYCTALHYKTVLVCYNTAKLIVVRIGRVQHGTAKCTSKINIQHILYSDLSDHLNIYSYGVTLTIGILQRIRKIHRIRNILRIWNRQRGTKPYRSFRIFFRARGRSGFVGLKRM